MKRNYTARVWAVLLSLVLVLSFAGCKSGNSTSESGSNQQKTTQIATDTSAEKQTTEPKEAKDKDKKDSGAKAEKDATSEKTVSSEQSTQKATTKTTKGAAKTTAAKKPAQTKTTANKPAAPPRRSLVGEAFKLTGEVQRMLIGTVDFGSGGITYQNPKDAMVAVRVRTKRNPDSGVQLYLVVKNKTGRPIRLNGYSNFAIRDLLGNELLSSSISLNKPVIMEDQEEELISVILPKEWYDLDELYQFTVESGIFNSVIALDYDFL